MRVLTLDRRQPTASAVAARDGRIQALGTLSDLRALIGPRTTVTDGRGGVAIPAFHDAHMHLLSYARTLSSADCGQARSLAELRQKLLEHARDLPPGAWLRGQGYDEHALAERRHPNRHDLDAVMPDHPLRLQHRSLHLEVLNSLALWQTGLMDLHAPQVEREHNGEPTGRVYQAAEVLRGRVPHRSEAELARDVRRASLRLLRWGVTSVQDASVSNGAEEWELFYRLAERGALGVRVFVFPGLAHWRQVLAGRPSGPRVRRGPVKVMLDEATTHPDDVRQAVIELAAAGQAVALHAVSEAEVAVALDILSSAGSPPGPAQHRIEHAAVLPDAWLETLRELNVTVVGQPALVHLRGDVYRAEYAPDTHAWLHRAGSLVRAGLRYAAGSDAPVTPPSPTLGMSAAMRRKTTSGAVLGPTEALEPDQALAAFTCWPAEALGVASTLGRLRPGMLADIAVLDQLTDNEPALGLDQHSVRLTIFEGRTVWDRDGQAERASQP